MSDARNEASWINGELTGVSSKCHTNPILLIHPYCDCYRSFSDFVKSPYMKSYPVGTYNYSSNFFGLFGWEASGSDPSKWDNRARPLDIIKVGKKHNKSGKNFEHVAVYLGNNKVCHMYDWRSPDKYMKARIDDISEFLGGAESTTRCGRVWVYHPIIPFNCYETITRRVASAEANDYWKGRYDLANRNCEHLANTLVYGINYSEQVEKDRGLFVVNNVKNAFLGGLLSLFWHDYSINNGKSTFKLTNEVRENRNKLSYSRLDHWRTQEIMRQYLQEVPTKQECRIM